MAESSHRRASSPLIGASLPPPIPEDEEDEEGSQSSRADPPNTLPVPQGANAAKSKQDLCSPQFLCVDESKRPRAHSDPSVTVGGFANYILPEITVTEDDGGVDASVTSGSARGGPHLFLKEPLEAIRKRSNTCPEDLFRPGRKGRPATPPPTDIVPLLGGKRRAHSAGGVRRFSFNFAPPPVAIKSPTSVSFAHHKLSKVSEDTGAECLPSSGEASTARMKGAASTKPSKPQHDFAKHAPNSPSQFKTEESSTSSRQTDSASGSFTSTEQTNTCSEHSQSQGKENNRLSNESDATNIPSLRETSKTVPATHAPMSTNGTDVAAPHRLKDLSSSKSSASQAEKSSAMLSDSLRTLSVADKPPYDSSSPKNRESASGIPKGSLSSWRAGDKSDNGNLAAF